MDEITFSVDPETHGWIRCDQDPAFGILVGMRAEEMAKRWNEYPALQAQLIVLREDK